MKKITKVLIGLAAIDFIDIAAKGQMLAGFKSTHPEVADEFNEACKDTKLIKYRAKMIDKISDVFVDFYSNK